MLTWMISVAQAATVGDTFPPPTGFTRVAATGFGQSLQRLQVAAADRPVRTHAGAVVQHHARVIQLPMVRGDLQQCADSAIRLRAEWARAQDHEISFHATSGDPIPWARFAAGETPYAKGSGLAWRKGSTGRWEDYLTLVFTWAGSWSLEAYDTTPVNGPPKPGDLLVEGGFPGHVVVLLDVATKGDVTRVLIGEGFMPAQDFHVELGPHSGWFTWDAKGLSLDHWQFEPKALRRFREG